MIKLKFFLDKDEEVKWLNDQSRKGLALKKYILGFYIFDKCEEDEYVYEIDFLNSVSEYASFKEFMNENNIDVVSRWYRWVYLRKVNDYKGFELYSDLDSKIEHYQKIKTMFKIAFIIELACLFIEIIVPLITSQMRLINFIFISIIVFFSIVIFGAYSKIDEKINNYIIQKEA
ncbi:MAG: DUF2812 domain-containing protein [Pleomorphochaeta sp.]|jgi:hypothetical protein|nr:DUF2812 domain-containing protein [Sphaerochaetaceae bacterium]